MCGGPFEHSMSEEDMLNMMFDISVKDRPSRPPTATKVPAVSQKKSGQPSTSKVEKVKAPEERTVNLLASSDGTATTPIDVEMFSPPKKATSKSKQAKKANDARQTRPLIVDTGDNGQDVLSDDDEVS
jgi:hypothetical protein